ncbi:probable N-acetyltransferase HLS1 [Diospyros lotus]|uniref:probable N-acetyltransferase HLS1 n=1 Tax=Diospyros lotus TaxID=55363 RepID=UPI00225B1FDB|nr:probable N-acetyltransferase HLS1 [Diospyros lotus]
MKKCVDLQFVTLWWTTMHAVHCDAGLGDPQLHSPPTLVALLAVHTVGCGCMAAVVRVREFDAQRDIKGVEEVERRCEVGPAGEISLFTDLLGDPMCRVRNSPAFIMLVAEKVCKEGEEAEIVGMIRGCIKVVTCGKKLSINGSDSAKTLPVYTKLAYILGLRVSPSYRRLGIGLKLVRRMEEWFRENGAQYSYMATEKDNLASINLFTGKCGYTEFRSPALLCHPVFGHRVRVSHRVTIIKLTPSDAETLYRRQLSTAEFFPRDIDVVLNNHLSLGTFVAVPRGAYTQESWPGAEQFLADPPGSWAMLSAWNCKDVYRLELRGLSRVKRGLAKITRMLDRAFPWLHVPSVPDLFQPFGFHFLYGLCGEGPLATKYIKALCGYAHNLAKDFDCQVVATEVANSDPIKIGIPRWEWLCAEDVWCIKRLWDDYIDGDGSDWTRSPTGPSVFVDPREV